MLPDEFTMRMDYWSDRVSLRIPPRIALSYAKYVFRTSFMVSIVYIKMYL
jgi:hypothetical protein